MSTQRRRLVIVGGGAGGLELATRLGREIGHPWDVVLVDRNMTHLWKPRLHEVAAGLLGPGDDEVTYAAQARAHGFRFEIGALCGLDPRGRRVRIAPVLGSTDQVLVGGRWLHYDRLVLALGSRVADFGVPGVRRHCHVLDTAEQAVLLHRSFLELAIQVAAGRDVPMRVVIVGAGATGIELAAELHHAVRELGRFGDLDAHDSLSITLIDRAPRVLASTSPETSAYAMAAMTALGVDVRLGAAVAEVCAKSVRLEDGTRIASDLTVWASGTTGVDVVARLGGLQLEHGDRIAVDPFLACEGVSDIYAIGDCAGLRCDDRFLPPTAQVASQQAAYLARVFAHDDRTPPHGFAFRSRGTLISLGEQTAVGDFPAPGGGEGTRVVHGAGPRWLYRVLFHAHRATLHGWARACAMALADRLRGLTRPRVKLH